MIAITVQLTPAAHRRYAAIAAKHQTTVPVVLAHALERMALEEPPAGGFTAYQRSRIDELQNLNHSATEIALRLALPVDRIRKYINWKAQK